LIQGGLLDAPGKIEGRGSITLAHGSISGNRGGEEREREQVTYKLKVEWVLPLGWSPEKATRPPIRNSISGSRRHSKFRWHVA
jgi:hypothetical protein